MTYIFFLFKRGRGVMEGGGGVVANKGEPFYSPYIESCQYPHPKTLCRAARFALKRKTKKKKNKQTNKKKKTKILFAGFH